MKRLILGGEIVSISGVDLAAEEFFGLVPKEIRNQLPEKCSHCPVLRTAISYALTSLGYEEYQVKKINRLDKAINDTPTEAPGAVGQFKSSMIMYEEELISRQAQREKAENVIASLIEAGSLGCPGTLIGDLTLTNNIARSASKYLPTGWGFGHRERSCPNPSFEMTDPSTAISQVLEGGNWVGGSSTPTM